MRARSTTPPSCFPDASGFLPPRLGDQNTTIRGGGLFYAGTSPFIRTDCVSTGDGQAAWTVTSTAPENFRLLYCVSPPGEGPPIVDAGGPVPPTRCRELVRAAPPRGPIKSKEVFKLPKDRNKRKCGTRKLKVAVTNPQNDPLVSLKVKLNGKTVKSFNDRQIRKKVTVGRQPQKAFKVEVSGVTASGKALKRTINYKKCIKRKRG